MIDTKNLVKKEDFILQDGKIDTVYTRLHYNVDKNGNKKSYIHVQHYIHSPVPKNYHRFSNINSDIRNARKMLSEAIVFHDRNIDFESHSPSKSIEMTEEMRVIQETFYNAQEIYASMFLEEQLIYFSENIEFLTKLNEKYPQNYKDLLKIFKEKGIKTIIEKMEENKKR
jgi:hypothetical protein